MVPTLINLGSTVYSYTSRSVISKLEFEKCDAVISCAGKPRLINKSHLGENRPILIDVGVSFVREKVVGDFDEDCREVAKYTPYVGGVGLITKAYLVKNVVESYLK